MITGEELKNRFTHHVPKGDQIQRYEVIRERALELAELILVCSVESREQSLSITALEEAVFWANAGIARRE